MNPGEVTTVIFKWDQPAVPFEVPFSDRPMGGAGATIANGNEFVWHCHILEHEEHDMMRPLVITGQNPQRPNIQPTAWSVAGATGGTQSFTVTVAAGTAFTVASNSLTITPSNVTTGGFQVVVPLGTAAGTVIFTVTSNGLSSTVTVTIT